MFLHRAAQPVDAYQPPNNGPMDPDQRVLTLLRRQKDWTAALYATWRAFLDYEERERRLQ